MPAGICAVILVLCLSPWWSNLSQLLSGILGDLTEFFPLILIILSVVSAELVLDAWLKTQKRHSRINITDMGIEFQELTGHKQILWKELTQVSWDTDAGKDRASYLVAELASKNTKIRVSEQFFRDREVKLIYGLAKIKIAEQSCF